MSYTENTSRADALDEICDHLRKMSGLVGLQEDDIQSPADGSISVGHTGVSVLWTSRPSPSWQVRERMGITEPSGERRMVSSLRGTIPEGETIRVAKVVMILVFERALDIEIDAL